MNPFLVIFLTFIPFVLPLYLFIAPSTFKSVPSPSLFEFLGISLDPHTALRKLLVLSRKYGDLTRIYLGPHEAIVTSAPADVAQILSTPDTFTRPPSAMHAINTVVPGGLLASPTKEHRIARKHLRPSFHHGMLHGFHGKMVQAVGELVENIKLSSHSTRDGSWSKPVDITNTLALCTSRIITNVAFGLDMSRLDRERFTTAIDVLVDEALREVLGYPVRQFLTPLGVRAKLFAERDSIHEICHGLIQKRKTESPEEKEGRAEDVLDVFLSLGQGDLSKITTHIIEFGVAGTHTTNHTLTWLLYEALRSPETLLEMEKEVAAHFGDRPLSEPITLEEVEQLSYMKKAMKEALRLHATLPFFPRFTTKEITLKGSGLTVPKGQQIIALLQGAQTHREVWKDPDMFDPERWGSASEPRDADRVPAGAYAPFSLGARNCVGRFLGDHQGPLIFAELLRQFEFKLGCGEDEVISCSGWAEAARCASVKGGPLDMGMPVQVRMRQETVASL